MSGNGQGTIPDSLLLNFGKLKLFSIFSIIFDTIFLEGLFDFVTIFWLFNLYLFLNFGI
jgi:hypothetical protein